MHIMSSEGDEATKSRCGEASRPTVSVTRVQPMKSKRLLVPSCFWTARNSAVISWSVVGRTAIGLCI